MTIFPFLTFNGNCQEAMEFYHSCFGGTLQFQYLGDSPNTEKLPETMKLLILHASLRTRELELLATDLVEEEGVAEGNRLSLFVQVTNRQDLRPAFEKLAIGGQVTSALIDSPEPHWATVTDRYGVQWIFSCHRSVS